MSCRLGVPLSHCVEGRTRAVSRKCRPSEVKCRKVGLGAPVQCRGQARPCTWFYFVLDTSRPWTALSRRAPATPSECLLPAGSAVGPPEHFLTVHFKRFPARWILNGRCVVNVQVSRADPEAGQDRVWRVRCSLTGSASGGTQPWCLFWDLSRVRCEWVGAVLGKRLPSADRPVTAQAKDRRFHTTRACRT